MNCAYCKGEINKTMNSCPHCGAPIQRSAEADNKVVETKRKQVEDLKYKRKLEDRAVLKKIVIGSAIFIAFCGVFSYFSSTSQEQAIYDAAKKAIEYKWDVKTMFEKTDADIIDEKSEYIVYGIIYENDATIEEGKRIAVRCVIPYDKGTIGRAVCNYEE